MDNYEIYKDMLEFSMKGDIGKLQLYAKSKFDPPTKYSTIQGKVLFDSYKLTDKVNTYFEFLRWLACKVIVHRENLENISATKPDRILGDLATHNEIREHTKNILLQKSGLIQPRV